MIESLKEWILLLVCNKTAKLIKEIEKNLMGKVIKILQLFIFAVFLSGSSFAQNKIAVVDTNAFYDEKSGIMEFIAANKTLQAEFKPQIEKFNDLGKELEKILSICSKTGHCGIDSIEKRIADYEKQKQHIEQTVFPQLEKQKSELVEPINKRVSERLRVFAKQKGFTSVIEVLKSEASEKSECVCYQGICIFYADYPDVTNEYHQILQRRV